MNLARARIAGLLAMGGAVLWAASWAFNLQTADDTRLVLGLSERGWRRLLDPALILVITGLVAYRSWYSWPGSRTALVGWAAVVLGLATALVGNVIEFWIGGLLHPDVPDHFETTDLLGWALFLVGVMVVVPVGFIVLGVAHLRSRAAAGWRRGLPLLIGILAAALAGMAIVKQDTLGAVLLSLAVGWVMLGYDLWSSARRAA